MVGGAGRDRAAVDGGFPTLGGALPFVGHMPEMYRGFPELCRRGARVCGPLFWVHGGPGARQLMCTDPSALGLLKSSGVNNSFYTDGFGALLGNTLLAFDGEEHRRVRHVLSPPFMPQRVRASDVMGIIEDTIRTHMDRWASPVGGVFQPFDIVAKTREVGIEIIFRVIGAPVSELPQWRVHYTRFLLLGLPNKSKVRGPIYWYASRSRAWIDERLGKIVDRLRETGETSTLVGAVANGRDEDGQLLDRQRVLDNLRILVFAGHETTASAVAWSTLHLAGSRSMQDRLAAEASGDGDLAELSMRSDRVTFGEALLREALRLYPAVHSILRTVAEPMPVQGGTIPAATLLNVPLVHLLRDGRRFEHPYVFDPDRWRERPKPGTLETAMFGGGPHFCLGYHIAIAEGTLFNLLLGRMMSERGLRLIREDGAPVPQPIYLPLTHPPRGLFLRFAREDGTASSRGGGGR